MAGRVYKATWGRIFALVYDTAFILAERRGFGDVRRDLVGQSKGRVVELGAGTGLNVVHYWENVWNFSSPNLIRTWRRSFGSEQAPWRLMPGS